MIYNSKTNLYQISQSWIKATKVNKKDSLLHFAPNWRLQFDLNNKLVIPSFSAVSQLRQGGKGYCSTNVKSSSIRLRISCNLVKSTLKSFTLTCLKTSFQIWKAQEPQQIKKKPMES